MLLFLFYALCIMVLFNSSSFDKRSCKWSSQGENVEYEMVKVDNGILCQDLRNTVPHFHIYSNKYKYYCHNNGKYPYPLCLTVSPLYRFRPCPVPFCKDSNCSYGTDYKGSKSVTFDNNLCLEWSLFQSYLQLNWWNFPERNVLLMNHNYCRNPDMYLNGPWCFYQNPNNVPFRKPCFLTKAFCDIYNSSSYDCKYPQKIYNGSIHISYDGNCTNTNCREMDQNVPSCEYNGSLSYCIIPYCKIVRSCIDASTSYFYPRSVTYNKDKCIYWNTTNYVNFYHEFPEGATDHNYCRNPLVRKGEPWCFIENNPEPQKCFKDFCIYKKLLDTIPCEYREIKSETATYDIIFTSSKCQKLCYVVVSEYMALIAVDSVKFYFSQQFNFTIIPTNHTDNFKFYILVLTINFYVCHKSFNLYLFDEDYFKKYNSTCIFTAECVTNHLESKWNLYRLYANVNNSLLCLDESITLTLNYQMCQLFALEKHPFAFKMNYNVDNLESKIFIYVTQPQFIKDNNIFPIVNYFFCNFCPIYKPFHLFQNYTISVTEYCNCLCHFEYSIYIRFNGRGFKLYKNKFELLGEKECRLIPKPLKDYPMFIKLPIRTEFQFKLIISEFDSDISVRLFQNENCIKNERTLYKVNLVTCCEPPCLIIVTVSIKNKMVGVVKIGTYKILVLPEITMKFEPPKKIKVVVKYPRNISCNFHKDFAKISWLKFAMEFNNVTVSTGNELKYPLDNNTSDGVNTFKCIMISYNFNQTQEKIVFIFKISYYFVDPFQIIIEGKQKYIVGSHEFVCKTNQNETEQKLNNYQWVGILAPIRLNSSAIQLSACNFSLCLKIQNNLPKGLYRLLCRVYLIDFNDKTKEIRNYEVNETIQFLKLGNSIYFIEPDKKFYIVHDFISCISHKPDYGALILNIYREHSNKPIYSTRHKRSLIPPDLSTGTYRIQCKSGDNEYNVIRHVINKGVILFPNLRFYKKGRRRIQCQLIPAMSGFIVRFDLSLMDIDGRNDLFFRTSKNTVYLKNRLKAGFHMVKCEIVLKFRRNRKIPISITDTISLIHTAYLSFISIRDLYIQFIDFRNLVFLDENITAGIFPYNALFINSLIYWKIYFKNKPQKIFSHHTNFNSTGTVWFLSNTTPATYEIEASFVYQDYSYEFYNVTVSKNASINLSGIKSFVIEPNNDVTMPQDIGCCKIDNVVPIKLILKVTRLKKNKIEYNKIDQKSSCFEMKLLSINLEYSITCSAFYNNFHEVISSNFIYLDYPTQLHIFPKSPTFGEWISCFPYEDIFKYENYQDLTFSMEWKIIEMPKVDIYLDLNISIVETKNIRLKLSELFSSFGNYVIKCEFNITIIDLNFTLSKVKQFTIADFNTPLFRGHLKTLVAPKLLPIIMGLLFISGIYIIVFGMSFYQNEKYQLDCVVLLMLKDRGSIMVQIENSGHTMFYIHRSLIDPITYKSFRNGIAYLKLVEIKDRRRNSVKRNFSTYVPSEAERIRKRKIQEVLKLNFMRSQDTLYVNLMNMPRYSSRIRKIHHKKIHMSAAVNQTFDWITEKAQHKPDANLRQPSKFSKKSVKPRASLRIDFNELNDSENSFHDENLKRRRMLSIIRDKPMNLLEERNRIYNSNRKSVRNKLIQTINKQPKQVGKSLFKLEKRTYSNPEMNKDLPTFERTDDFGHLYRTVTEKSHNLQNRLIDVVYKPYLTSSSKSVSDLSGSKKPYLTSSSKSVSDLSGSKKLTLTKSVSDLFSSKNGEANSDKIARNHYGRKSVLGPQLSNTVEIKGKKFEILKFEKGKMGKTTKQIKAPLMTRQHKPTLLQKPNKPTFLQKPNKPTYLLKPNKPTIFPRVDAPLVKFKSDRLSILDKNEKSSTLDPSEVSSERQIKSSIWEKTDIVIPKK